MCYLSSDSEHNNEILMDGAHCEGTVTTSSRTSAKTDHEVNKANLSRISL